MHLLLNVVKHVARYLKGTSTMGIIYDGEGCKLEADLPLGLAYGFSGFCVGMIHYILECPIVEHHDH